MLTRRIATTWRWLGWLGLPAVAITACSDPPPIDMSGPVAGWPQYGATKGGGHDSALTQITRDNLDRLQMAWIYHTGDVAKGPGAKSSFQTTPILVDDTLYFCSPFNRVIALDAETGAERWTFDPGVNPDNVYLLNCRGVSAWKDPQRPEGGLCAERIITGTVDARLIALDRASGQPCRDFGEEGQVDLTRGIGNTQPGEYGVTSPPAVFGDLIIVGTMILDNVRADAPGGVVRAYDARDGTLRWAWDPIIEAPAPNPADPPRTADPRKSYRRGTANAWSILSVDVERGLVFVPTGNAPPDYYGADRGGLDYFSSAVIALSARTGELVWRFQTVHHDLWDLDVPAQPTLFDFKTDGTSIPALVQATKMGHLFFLNRTTGEPIFPVEERPVPGGGVPGETLSPTQPFPTRPPPLHPASLVPDDAFGITPWDRGVCRDHIAALRHEGIFTPPSLQGTVLYPGPGGGSNWGSVAIDRERRLLIANTSRVPFSVKLIPRAEVGDAGGWDPAGLSPMHGTPYVVETIPLMSPFGVPCSPPPWGVLTGIDIESGEVRWEVPLGTTRDLAPFPFWAGVGVPNMGGPIVTASGLTFIAASMDNYLRAFDTTTGEELWKGRLPAGGQATPMTYRTRADGRQFVVIAAGGHGNLGTALGDSLVAFALE